MKDIDLEIITASFERFRNGNYIAYTPISCVGNFYSKDKSISVETEQLRGLSIFRMFENQRAKDFKACYMLYQKRLEKKGVEKILQEITELCQKNNTQKAVILGYGKEDEFCYRHILLNFLLENLPQNFSIQKEKGIDYQKQKEYWEKDIYQSRGHFGLSNEEVGDTLEKMQWRFAKTMQKNPHFYTLRRDFSEENEGENMFLKLVHHIRYFGELEEFEGVIYRVWTYKSLSYWTMPCDFLNEDCDLINKRYND
jgi:hypothetical protein